MFFLYAFVAFVVKMIYNISNIAEFSDSLSFWGFSFVIYTERSFGRNGNNDI